jgi:DNA modification methylase
MKVKLPNGEIQEVEKVSYKHKLMCGSSESKEEIEKLVGNQQIKTIFTSPPYNMGAKLYRDYADNLKSEEYIKFNLNVIGLWKEKLKGFLFWNISYNKNARWEFLDIMSRIAKETGLKFLELIIWDKGTAMPIRSDKQLTRQYEDILLVSTEDIYSDIDFIEVMNNDKSAVFNKTKGVGISNYWKIPVGKSQTEIIGACFPVKLPIRAILLTTNEGDTIGEPFAGSGTVIVASELTNRHSLNMELDPVYVSACLERYENLGKRWHKIEG